MEESQIQEEKAEDEVDSKQTKGKDGRSKKQSSDFGGPIGAFLSMLMLPSIVVLLNLACTKVSQPSPRILPLNRLKEL